VIRLLLTVSFINILFSVFLFIKPSEIKEDLIFEINKGDSYLKIIENLENIDITIPSFVTVILQYASLDKNITYGDFLIRKHENLISVLTKIISSDTHFRKYRIPNTG
jgi:cell division protein YceG involved in septum cleavage